MVPPPPRPPTAFVITRGRRPGPLRASYACVSVTLRTNLATFGRTAAALPLYLRGLALEDGEVVRRAWSRAGHMPLIMWLTWR
jgi:hypothetical protein